MARDPAAGPELDAGDQISGTPDEAPLEDRPIKKSAMLRIASAPAPTQ
jgi:hypothetical protein